MTLTFDKKAEEIIDKAGLNKLIEKLPNSMDIIIAKEYDTDGIELSGDAYQKIAIARAAYKAVSLLSQKCLAEKKRRSSKNA